MIKSGGEDTGNANNDITSATTSTIGPNTSGTTKSIDIYAYCIGTILLATGVCVSLYFKPTKVVGNVPDKREQIKPPK